MNSASTPHAARLLVVMGTVLGVARGVAQAGGWDDRFSVRGVDGEVRALLSDGTDLYAAGSFRSAGKVAANNVARWDGTTWNALGSGVDGPSPYVFALAWDGSSLYAGGQFTEAGGVPASRIARWDGTSWRPLDSGMDRNVWALAWDGSDLYAGGSFTNAGGVAASSIARWDGVRWSPLSSGMNGTVYALAWDGSSIYAGGDFTAAGGTRASSIARWDGTGWSRLDSGTDGRVHALAWGGSRLYAGGWFTTAGGVSALAIAQWDGVRWEALGSGMDNAVHALAWDGSTIYAGGDFSSAGGVPTDSIAHWDGMSWTPVGTGMNRTVFAVSSNGPTIYAGGDFSTAGGGPAGHLAQWDGAAWSTLPAVGEGVIGLSFEGTSCLAWSGSSLYVGGHFTATGGIPANNIARWDGTSWSSLNSGLDGYVYDLAWDGSDLYAGGLFIGPAESIARWDGTNWSPVGGGVGGVAVPSVYALALTGSSLYAGGWFSLAGGRPANSVARWDGTRWNRLGNGVGGTYPHVYALAWNGSSLFAGGRFTMAGNVPASHIARWDGTSWSSLGSGTNDYVAALAWDGTNLYAGGVFTSAGGISANHIACWDGTTWRSLGGGVDGGVGSLAWNGSYLYAGGAFTKAGSVSANSIARWDGTSWSALGGGTGLGVDALTWDGSSLFAGGGFHLAGGKPSVLFARWTCLTLAVSPNSLPTATSGALYTVTFAAASGTPPYTFAITTGSAPPGLSLSTSGVLSGTPTTPGVYPFTVTATDAETCAGTVSLVLLVDPPGCPIIAITPATLPDAQIGAGYAVTLTATGGAAPYTFDLAGGTLPPGVALARVGVLSGTPWSAGVYSFTVVAADTTGCRGIRSCTLLVSTGYGNVVAGEGLGPPNPNRVRVFTGAGLPAGPDFFAYGASSWGVSVAAGDLGADPRRVDQILTGPGPGPVLGPHVRGFLRDGTAIAKVSYYAYGTLRYGVNPGAGLLDADGFDEILTGAGAVVVFGPHVRGWNCDGPSLTAIAKISYFAYGTLRYGVNLHRGDVDGDGFAEILTGPGPGAMFGPQLRGFNYDGTALTSINKINFNAFGTSGYGVNLAGGALDLDAFDELACATGPGPSFTPDFRGFGYDASTVTPLPGLVLTLSSTTGYGGRVGLGDVTGDAVADLLAGKGRDPGADAHVSRYDYATGSLVAMSWFDAFPGASYGANPAGMDGGF